MKRIPLSILIAMLVGSLYFIFKYQANDTMAMKHWIELIGIEFIVQIIYNRITGKNNGNIS